MIITFDHWLNARSGREMTWDQYLRDRWSRGPGGPLPDRPPDDELGHRAAFVDEGRWLVSCVCRSAAYVTPNQPYHICAVCGVEPWVMVDFPADKDDIEAVLDLRPYRANQNWYAEGALDVHPAETLDDLLRENKKNGVDIPRHLERRPARNGG